MKVILAPLVTAINFILVIAYVALDDLLISSSVCSWWKDNYGLINIIERPDEKSVECSYRIFTANVLQKMNVFFSWFSWLWYYIILYIIEIWIHISKFPDFGFKNYLPLNGWIGSRYMFSSIWVIRYIVELYETNNDLKKFRSIRKNSFFNWFKIMLFFQYTEFFLIIIRQLSGESKSI